LAQKRKSVATASKKEIAFKNTLANITPEQAAAFLAKHLPSTSNG